ncbi:MAG: hypothetical protein GXY48_10840 [Methanomicrobiales archaeon]|nr:hypothetical protein [Methanomicrobiales archaeon]
MNFNDIMVLITGFLCFMVGIALVPLINSYVQTNVGFDLPAALIGVVDLILILAIVYIHTAIVTYNQKRKNKSISKGMSSIFKNPEDSDTIEE